MSNHETKPLVPSIDKLMPYNDECILIFGEVGEIKSILFIFVIKIVFIKFMHILTNIKIQREC